MISRAFSERSLPPETDGFATSCWGSIRLDSEALRVLAADLDPEAAE